MAATDTQITLVDASPFMNGDVFGLVSGERVESIGDPNLSDNTPVRRGAEGTTVGTGSTNDVIQLIGNSRTGAEINQNGVALIPVGVSQFCQTWQHPVQVGGSLSGLVGVPDVRGARTPFEQYKMDALQNLMDDMESTSYYGIGEDPRLAARPKQKGLRTLLTSNLTTSPINAGVYKATDFMRDTLKRAGQRRRPGCAAGRVNFMTGSATWGQAVERIDAGVNVFGTPIDVFDARRSSAVSR